MKKLAMHHVVGLAVMATFSGSTWAANKAPETIFRANCASCHGQYGEGGQSWVDPKKKAFAIAGKQPSNIEQWVRTGRPPEMPSWGLQEINAAEMAALADYIYRLPGSYISEPVAEHTVTIKDEDPWYNPMQLTVNRYDTVKFINMGKTYHPVTQLEYVATRGAQGTDSGQLGSSRSASLYGVYYRTITEPVGTKLTFMCKIHPYMRGEVYVGTTFTPPTWHEDAALAPPAVAGTGKVYYNAQWQDWPGKAPDPVDGLVKDGVVHVIDAATWTDVAQIPVGNNPHNIWMGKGNTKALTTNWYDNTVSMIDTNTYQVLGEFVAGAAPAHVTSDHAGVDWFVTIEASNYIQPMTQNNFPLTPNSTVFPVSGYGPHGIWYGGGKLTTSNTLDNTFNVVDVAHKTDLGRVNIGLYPLGSSANTTGTLGASGNYLDNTVSIIDLTTSPPTIIRNVSTAGLPVQVPFTADNNYIVFANSPYTSVIDVNKAIAKNPDGTFTYTDAQIRADVWTGKGAHGVAFIPKVGGGQYAVVSHKYENYMAVVDITNPMAPVHAGDVQITMITPKGKVAIVGITDTGGNAIASNPNPAPWQ